MVASEKVLDSLKDIGLNLYERKLFIALLARGTSTAGELAEISNVPRSRTYDVLETLANKGFLVMQNAKPMKYVAIEPKQALESAKTKMREDMEIVTQKMDELKTSPIVEEMEDLYHRGIKLVEPSEMTGSLRGKNSVKNHMGSMFKSAKSDVQIITTKEGFSDLLNDHFEILRDASKNGVRIKVAAPVDSEEAMKSLKQFAEVKKLNQQKGSLCIVDGKQVLFGLTDEKTHHTQHLAIWTNSEHAATEVFGTLFNHVWK
ncbi:MAG: helix-turn-helix domain-containing protein, partial [Candidatus Aenigmatarchaeota archaeon]